MYKIPLFCSHAVMQVGLGRVKWVAPSGLVGLGPLAAVGPVDLGPGPAERSSAALQELIVRVDPVQSLVQGKLVLQLHADAAKVGPQMIMLSKPGRITEGLRSYKGRQSWNFMGLRSIVVMMILSQARNLAVPVTILEMEVTGVR